MRDSYRDNLAKLGWVEGQNLVFEWHVTPDATGTAEWMEALERDFARGERILLFTNSSPHAAALKKATSRIPIVVSIGDPVSTGLVASQARPGGNITGTSTSPFSQTPKRIEVLKELLPGAKHLGILYADTSTPNLQNQVDGNQTAARQLGMDSVVVRAAREENLDAAFDQLQQARVDAVYVVQDVLTSGWAGHIADMAKRRGLPTMCARSDWVAAGCLLSYATNRLALIPLWTNYADRILRGANPGDLPIQLPTTFDLSINQTTAEALGVSIPPAAVPLVTEWIP